MPTYVYACNQCDHRFEVVQSFSDRALRKCPECSVKALRKVLFPAGVVFKGSGFYVTDSRNASSSNGKKPISQGKGEPASKKESKSESKAESSQSEAGKPKSGKQPAASGKGHNS